MRGSEAAGRRWTFTPASFSVADLPAFTDFVVPYRMITDVCDGGHNYGSRPAAGATTISAPGNPLSIR